MKMRGKTPTSVAIVILIFVIRAVSQETGVTTVNSGVIPIDSAKRASTDSIQLRKPHTSRGASSWGPPLTVPTAAQKASETISLRNGPKPAVMGNGGLGVASPRTITPTSDILRRSPDKRATSAGPLNKQHSSVRPSASSRSMMDVGQSEGGLRQLAKQNHSIGHEHLALETGIELHRNSKDLKPKVSTLDKDEKGMKTKHNQLTVSGPKSAGDSKVRSASQEKMAKPFGGIRGR